MLLMMMMMIKKRRRRKRKKRRRMVIISMMIEVIKTMMKVKISGDVYNFTRSMILMCITI